MCTCVHEWVHVQFPSILYAYKNSIIIYVALDFYLIICFHFPAFWSDPYAFLILWSSQLSDLLSPYRSTSAFQIHFCLSDTLLTYRSTSALQIHFRLSDPLLPFRSTFALQIHFRLSDPLQPFKSTFAFQIYCRLSDPLQPFILSRPSNIQIPWSFQLSNPMILPLFRASDDFCLSDTLILPPYRSTDPSSF